MEDYLNISKPNICARFYLDNNDSIMVEGNSVAYIFFELNRRFPNAFRYKAVSFSGKNEEESRKNLQDFFVLARKYR